MSNYRFQFSTEEERSAILENHSDKYLIEEERLFEGNFLTLTDVKPIEVEIEEIRRENEVLKQSVAELSFLVSVGGV